MWRGIRMTAFVLQWGRDLVIAEIVAASPQPAGVWGLQWGRDLVIAEMNRI